MMKIVLLLFLAVCSLGKKIQSYPVSITQFQKSFSNLFCDCSFLTCYSNFKYLRDLPETRNFDGNTKFITQNSYGITTVIVSIFQNTFPVQIDGLFRVFTVKSIVFLPENAVNIKGIILYNHPTYFGKLSQPSSLNEQTKATAGIYLSQNFAVVFSDFPGFQPNVIQPYILFPRVNICSEFAVLKDPQFLSLMSSFPNKKKLFTIGYSEGGILAMWVDKMRDYQLCSENIQDYQIVKIAALEGPYDLLNVVRPFLLDNVTPANSYYRTLEVLETNVAKGGLAALAMSSFMNYIGYQGQHTLQEALQKDFYAMKCDIQVDKLCSHKFANIAQALNSASKSQEIATQIGLASFMKTFSPDITKYALRQGLKTSFESPINHIKAIVRQEIINSQGFTDVLTDATIVGYKPSVKPFFFSLQRDSVVSPRNYLNYIELLEAGQYTSYFFPNDKFKVCPGQKVEGFPIDHIKGQLLANIFALKYVLDP